MNIFFNSEEKDHRYERKFYLENWQASAAELVIRKNPAVFKQIYAPRVINNIYFDSPSMQYFADNMNGVNERLKYRIRWYGNTFGAADNPALEVKVKRDFLVKKYIYPLPPFSLKRSFGRSVVIDILSTANMPHGLKHYLKGLNASLVNTYYRKYFLSFCRRFRITIDTNMTVYKIRQHSNTFCISKIDKRNVIIELKYAREHDDEAHHITNFFPFRMTKSSKYSTGILNLTKK